MSVFRFGGIMLPSAHIDLEKFACIACDQFTSDKKYWQSLYALVGDEPSSLGIICPEIFLNDDFETRIKNISVTARRYLESGVFSEREHEAVIVERSTPYAARRLGLVAGINLDDYSVSGEPLIRATEGVVEDRLPPRIEIRKVCPVELPHVMLLCDDEDGLLVENAYKNRGEKLYDFDLNMGGGHIRGYEARDTAALEKAAKTLAERSAEKYGKPFLFAVGDGNHSLAAAKALHDRVKDSALLSSALVEIVNVRDEGIVFHPIHRLVKTRDNADFIRFAIDRTRGLPRHASLYDGKNVYSYNLPADACEGVELITRLIDEYGAEKIDYIHGEDMLVSPPEGYVGIRLFAPEKAAFFETVAKRGKLPKKTFSIGEGVEKRYYLEARRISK